MLTLENIKYSNDKTSLMEHICPQSSLKFDFTRVGLDWKNWAEFCFIKIAKKKSAVLHLYLLCVAFNQWFHETNFVETSF